MNETLKETLKGLKPEEKAELLNILSENKGQADSNNDKQPVKEEQDRDVDKDIEKTKEKEQNEGKDNGEGKEDKASNKDSKKDVVNENEQHDPNFDPKAFLNELQSWRKEFNEKFNQLADENYKLKDENTKLKNQKQRGFEPKPNPTRKTDERVEKNVSAMRKNKW